MKIAHFCQLVTEGNPTGTSGMYLVTKDMIKYERRAGHESELIDPYHEVPDADHKDGWLVPKPWKWAIDAPIWVIHRKVPDPFVKVQKNHGLISILHGPAEHMLQMEITSGGNSTNFNVSILVFLDSLLQLGYDCSCNRTRTSFNPCFSRLSFATKQLEVLAYLLQEVSILVFLDSLLQRVIPRLDGRFIYVFQSLFF
jgi:hypothetical protein